MGVWQMLSVARLLDAAQCNRCRRGYSRQQGRGMLEGGVGVQLLLEPVATCRLLKQGLGTANRIPVHTSMSVAVHSPPLNPGRTFSSRRVTLACSPSWVPTTKHLPGVMPCSLQQPAKAVTWCQPSCLEPGLQLHLQGCSGCCLGRV
jgi:hypothetical protein